MGHKECVPIQNREGFTKEGCESSKNHSGVLEGVQIDRAFIKEGCSDIEVLLYVASVASTAVYGCFVNPLQPATRRQIVKNLFRQSCSSLIVETKNVVVGNKNFFVIEWSYVVKWQHPAVREQKF